MNTRKTDTVITAPPKDSATSLADWWRASVPFALLATAVLCLGAQDPLKLAPDNYRLIFENQRARVIDVLYNPHERLPVLSHSDKPTVYVYLTDSGPVRFSHVEEHAFTLNRPPEKAGTFRISPGRIEKHSIENLGDIPTEFLRVELKQVPLGFQESSFRSPKIFDATHTGVKTEFPGPYVRVDRIVAGGGQVREESDLRDPSLLISFSASQLELGTHSGDPQSLRRGDVRWIEAGGAYSIQSADTTTPAHLLRIVFLAPTR